MAVRYAVAITGSVVFVPDPKAGIGWQAQHRVEENELERVLQRLSEQLELPDIEAPLAALVA